MTGDILIVIAAILSLVLYFTFKFQYRKTEKPIYNTLKNVMTGIIVVMVILLLTIGR